MHAYHLYAIESCPEQCILPREPLTCVCRSVRADGKKLRRFLAARRVGVASGAACQRGAEHPQTEKGVSSQEGTVSFVQYGCLDTCACLKQSAANYRQFYPR